MDFIVAYYMMLSIEKVNLKNVNKVKVKEIIKPIICNMCGQNMYWCLCKYK